jgi:Tfp pilus assembly major pilin PilA
MAIVIASTTALSTGANTKSADIVTGTYQFIGKGSVTLVAKGSATGMYITCLVGGVALVNDQAIPYTGTAGTISINDNVMCTQMMNGGRVEVYLRNSTGGALTTDVLLLFNPGK